MKIFLKFSGLIIFLLLTALGCTDKDSESFESKLPERSLTEDFKKYWFIGEAEITSYKLEQSRYGENREGTAVLIFVTEDFLPKDQVKAYKSTNNSIPILKLNATKNFLTGIYPYSIMQSTFYPLEGNSHAIKVAASIQEWCGQVYVQLNNRENFEIVSHSYFDGEADQELALFKTNLENEVWTQLRIDPDLLPTGEIEMVPSMEYLKLSHQEIKSYAAMAEFYQDQEYSVYKVSYPGLKRELKIYYNNFAPYTIEKWTEQIEANGVLQTSTATKLETLKIDYWNKNSNKDLPLRDQLKLN
tara:strand:+ start:23573 stop:24475 length:903 start_codon:yes stop_codon:yes gene_type:complete